MSSQWSWTDFFKGALVGILVGSVSYSHWNVIEHDSRLELIEARIKIQKIRADDLKAEIDTTSSKLNTLEETTAAQWDVLRELSSQAARRQTNVRRPKKY